MYVSMLIQRCIYQMQEEMASCPFNSAHTFSRDKFVFHLNRCKDRQKVQHLFSRCPYNSLHFVRNEQYASHAESCPNRAESITLIERARRNYNQVIGNRERSIDNIKRQEEVKKEEVDADDDEDIMLSDCEECQQLIKRYSHRLEGDKRYQKYMNKYKEINMR